MVDPQQAAEQPIARRLYTQSSSSFSGKLKCTMDASMPFNVSDVSQPFLMSCESPSDNTVWWVLLYIACGCIGIFVFLVLLGTLLEWRDSRKEARERNRLAAEKAAGNEAV